MYEIKVKRKIYRLTSSSLSFRGDTSSHFVTVGMTGWHHWLVESANEDSVDMGDDIYE